MLACAMLDAAALGGTLGPKPWPASEHSLSPRLSLANSEFSAESAVDEDDFGCACGCRCAQA
jgi:hypothetical protein